MVICKSVIDWRTFEIPFSLNVAIGVLAVIRIILDHKNLLDYLIGFCVISGFMLICLFIGPNDSTCSASVTFIRME